MANGTMGVMPKLILAFITLLLGVVLITVVASNGNNVTDKTVIYNDTVTMTLAQMNWNGTDWQIDEAGDGLSVTNAPGYTWKNADCPLTSVTVHNATGGQAFTLTTDYTIDLNTGVLSMKNTTNTDMGQANATLVDYTYCADGYMNLSWGRTMINLIAGFFALAIMGASLGLFYSIAKDTGLL